MSNEVPMSKNAKELKKQIESKRKDLDIYKNSIDPKDNESVTVLLSRKEEKEKDLKDCYWFQVINKINLGNEIQRIEKRIEGLLLLEKLKEEVDDLQEKLNDYIPGQVWEGYPESLDDKIVNKYQSKFKTLFFPLTPNVQFFNIIMIGEAGAGKSCLLRTFETAITNKEEIKDTYRVGPSQSGRSATQQIHMEPMYIGENDQYLPCRFFDMPGLDDIRTITKEQILRIIDNQIKNAEETQRNSEEEPLRNSKTSGDNIHCILYVISAKSSLSTKVSKSLGIMKDILRKKHTEDGVRQFVVVTAIDKIGVPNEDMKNAYRYGCVRKLCERVSEVFDVDLYHVIPVSNYFLEVAPNDAKNAMSLFNLWRIFHSGRDFIERHWNKKEAPVGSRKLIYLRE